MDNNNFGTNTLSHTLQNVNTFLHHLIQSPSSAQNIAPSVIYGNNTVTPSVIYGNNTVTPSAIHGNNTVTSIDIINRQNYGQITMLYILKNVNEYLSLLHDKAIKPKLFQTISNGMQDLSDTIQNTIKNNIPIQNIPDFKSYFTPDLHNPPSEMDEPLISQERLDFGSNALDYFTGDNVTILSKTRDMDRGILQPLDQDKFVDKTEIKLLPKMVKNEKQHVFDVKETREKEK